MKIYKHICKLSYIYLFTVNISVFASSGTLNTSFGANNTGITSTAIGRYNALQCIAVQPDDTIMGVGTVSVFDTASGICCFTANGILNTAYNGCGYVELTVGSKTILNAIALQTNRYAVVGGYAFEDQTNFTVARYDTTGALDQSFNGNGYATTPIGSGSNINALIIQPDGNIIAGGVAFQDISMFALARYTTNGVLDQTFGDRGVVLTAIQEISCINALALQTDGKILAAGFSWNGSNNQWAVARYNTNGSLDETFGNQGIVIISPGIWSEIQAIGLQADGSIILGGSMTNDNLHYSFVLMRLDTNGNPDVSFNTNGTVITPINYSAAVNSLVIQSDNNIVVGGSNFGARATNFALARYLPSGVLDQTFGTNGITLTTIGAMAQINSLALQSSGSIIAAGFSDDYAIISQYIA